MTHEIAGAPDWVQEFLSRVDTIIETHAAKELISQKSVLEGMNEISETVGRIAGAVSRLDKKVEYLRGEIRSTRQEVGRQGGRLDQLEEELHAVRDQMEALSAKSVELEGEIQKLRREVKNDDSDETPS